MVEIGRSTDSERGQAGKILEYFMGVWSICNLYIAWIQCGFLLKGNSVPSLAEMSQFDYCIFVVYFMLSTFGAPIFLYNRYALWRYLRSYDLNEEGKEK